MTRTHIGSIILLTLALAPACAQVQPVKETPRALMGEFKNTSRDNRKMLAPMAEDALAVEFMKRNALEVVSRSEVERAATRLGIRAPFREEDLAKIAREVSASAIVSGEVASIEPLARDGKRGIEAGLIVRVKDVELGEMINGAAVKAFSMESADGQKTEGSQAIDAVAAAAFRAVQRIIAYQPITGTILNSSGAKGLVLNRGSGHGVRKRQEFLIFRSGVAVGRARVTSVSPSYSELAVVENTLGIQGQDRALAVFPEPKFSDK